jgi:hypothetical protein
VEEGIIVSDTGKKIEDEEVGINRSSYTLIDMNFSVKKGMNTHMDILIRSDLPIYTYLHI